MISHGELASSVSACLGELMRPEELEWRAIPGSEPDGEPGEFLIRGRPGIVGSLFVDDAGPRARGLLMALRHGGFGATGPYRVPEPLGACADRRLLLARMPSACTESLAGLLDRDPDVAARGVREAARWLLALHGSRLRLGVSDHPWRLLGQLADELAAVAASRPAEAGRFNELLERLSAIEDTARPEEVQIHGRFRPCHVYPAGDVACATALDRSQPSDPARDLADFVHGLRAAIDRARGPRERAESLTAVFLGEYAHRRDPALGRVAFFRAAASLLSLCRHQREGEGGARESREAADFQAREFEDALSSLPAGNAGAADAAGEAPGDFEARAASMMDPAFVEKVVFPAVYGKAPDGPHPLAFEASLPQENRETGRVTVRYRFGGGDVVFGKLYPVQDPDAHRIMRQLRRTGFGDGHCRVAEPLAFVPEHRLLLTRAAPGVPLGDCLGKEGPAVVESLRRTARWLVRLHTSPLRLGSPESVCGSLRLLTVVRRFFGAAVAVPDARDRSRRMLRELWSMAEKTGDPVPPVQTHGSFHHEHVFVSADAVTVIDFDKSRPADPARDLAEFLMMYRRKSFSRTGNPVAADGATRAFLEEYARHLPEHLRSLAVYWGAAILFDLPRFRKRAVQDAALDPLVAFLERDFDAVLSGAFAAGAAPGAG